MGGGRWFLVKNLEKEELSIKYFWCGIGWRVFEGNPSIFAMKSFFWVKAYFFRFFQKQGSSLFLSPPPPPGLGSGHSWPEYLLMSPRHMKQEYCWCTMVECTLNRLMVENWWILFFILCLFLWSLAKCYLPLLLCLYVSIGN